jgi:26S proteasome non-ATPase regulatory subunit 9
MSELAGSVDLRAVLRDLDAARQAVEAEMGALIADLTSRGPTGAPPAGLDTPLVDTGGYPRADVDVYAVRGKRQRLNCLRTDRRALQQQLEAALVELHSRPARAEAAEAPASTTANDQAAAATVPAPPAALEPFARIAEVVAGSPADGAGLRAGDIVLRFGRDVVASNHRGLEALALVVAQNLQRPIEVFVRRGGGGGDGGGGAGGSGGGEAATHVVVVTPRPWAGRGVLGCQFLPYTEP